MNATLKSNRRVACERTVAFYYNVITFHRDVLYHHNDDAKYQHLTYHSHVLSDLVPLTALIKKRYKVLFAFSLLNIM